MDADEPELEFVEMGLAGRRDQVLQVTNRLFPFPSALGEELRSFLNQFPESCKVIITFDIL